MATTSSDAGELAATAPGAAAHESGPDSSPIAPLGANPFVGPQALQTGQRIFGRDREIDELYYLLAAERIVLLHSPSGAGKSSLIRAGLVPRLQARFDVRGPTRLNAAPEPDDAGVNRYVRSANLGFEQEVPEGRRRPVAQVSRMTLAEYVAQRPRRRAGHERVVLIFDQFEEVLTADPLAMQAKRAFFTQLGELLLDPTVWALFALREDYLAQLDPYATLLPTHLKNRFRLDLLGRDAAQAAMQGIAEQGGRVFEPAAAQRLTRDLATMQVQQPDGHFEPQVGPSVEPLHLQVACRALWERMPPDDRRIEAPDIQSFGDVDQSLAAYYEGSLARVPGDERSVREWVGQRLITPDGIRAQVLRGPDSSGGLDNTAVTALVDAHLVRGDLRGGAVWYELAHDRLVAPVRRSNDTWFERHLHPMQRQAALWMQEGQPDRLLLRGADLTQAEDWARTHAAAVQPGEQDLLERSSQQRRAQRLRLGAGVLALAMLAVGAGGLIWVQRERARQQQALAEEQQALAEERLRNVEALSAKVLTLEQAQGEAQQARADRSAELATQRAANAALRGEVELLQARTQKIQATLEPLRAENRARESLLERLAIEYRHLDERSLALQQAFERGLTESMSLGIRTSKLTPLPPTLDKVGQDMAQTSEQLARRARDLEARVRQTYPCDYRPHLTLTPSAGMVAPPLPPDRRPTRRPEAALPDEQADSAALRARIDELARALAALVQERARQVDEAAFLQQEQVLLAEQRGLLTQELARLNGLQASLLTRRRVLVANVAAALADLQDLQTHVAIQDKRDADQRRSLEQVREEHAAAEEKVVDASKAIVSQEWNLDSSRREIGIHNQRLSPIVERLLGAAADARLAPDLTALLAVKAWRWAPYNTDDAATPAVYNRLWLSLRRVDAQAALALLAPSESAPGKLATTQSEAIVQALCQRVGRPVSADEWKRHVSTEACFTPETAAVCIR